MCTEKMHIEVRCIKYSETNNKINTGFPIKKRSVKQLVIKPWDGFCGPLEVRTHPLHCTYETYRGLEVWVLRFRDLGVFVFEF